ncbi:MAG: MurR/RpiR family transcriptional regulator [Streptococcaceae bacterium]|jgi:DNA-binding MurR/RpiR family transcriptional regulator|nr:MurR/RpiR family transcriptional regulator [Streptococcaceae bacterium]
MGIFLNKFTDLSILTTTEINILTQLDNSPELLQDLNLTQLALNCAASNTALIRLAQKLGYSGFSEFKFEMKQVSNKTNFIASNLLSVFQDFFESFLSDGMESNLDSFIRHISKSKLIYIAGVGSSKPLAEYMAHRLSQLDHPSIYQYDNALLDLLPNLLSHKGLVIYISITGETLRLVNSAKKVVQIGVPVLSITNNSNSTLSHLSTVNIATQIPTSYFHNYDITARTFQMAVIDLLIERLIKYMSNI